MTFSLMTFAWCALDRAGEQRAALRDALWGAGWNVVVLPIIIGSWGTMRTNTKGSMLGIEPEAANALLKELCFDSIYFTNDVASSDNIQLSALVGKSGKRDKPRARVRMCGRTGLS